MEQKLPPSDDSSARFTEALRAARNWQRGALRCALIFECPSAGCSVQEVRLLIHEQAGGKPMQWPVLCGRCRGPLVFVRLD